jgi:recombination protein RecA
MAKETVKGTPKDINELLKNIEKDFGSGSLMRGRGKMVDVEVFPTNIAAIDFALGAGGIPLGRIIELYGAESSGKTTTCLAIVAACQKHTFPNKKRRGVAAVIDAEHALDPRWAEKIGVDMDNLIISQPDSGEQGFQILERLVDSEMVDLIVVDSVAALVPLAMLEGEITDANVGAQARLMSKGLNKIKGKCNRTGTTVIFINQIREKIGVMFGNPEQTPGGRALKFYSTIRAEVRKGSSIKIGDTVVGFRPTIKMVKNKVAAPFMQGSFDICFGLSERPVCGIDAVGSLIDMATENNIIKKNGSFFAYGDVKLGNGMNNASHALRENTVLLEEIRRKLYEQFGQLERIEQTEEKDDDESEV